jgi:hypothetical protein
MGERLVPWLGLLGVLVMGAPAPAQLPQFTHNALDVQRLAIEGQQAPGMPTGVTFAHVGGPGGLGADGGAVFTAILEGPGIEYDVNDLALYGLHAGQLAPVVRAGDPAPGITPPATFSAQVLFQPHALNGAGQVAFDATTWDGSAYGGGTWLYGPGAQPQLLATPGMPAPGTNGLIFTTLAQSPRLNERAHLAFQAKVGPPGTAPYGGTYGVWSDRGGAMTEVYDASDATPIPGTIFNAVAPLCMTPDDRLVLGARLAGQGITTANDTVILAERSGQLVTVAREGDPAPGAGGAAFSSDVYFARFNAEGRAAMTLPVAGSGVTTANNVGIWSEAGGPLRLVARKGDPAPGAGAGVTFTNFDTNAPYLNSAGQTLFKAGLSNTTGQGQSIWLDNAGSLTMLAKYGQFAPGFGPNAYFGLLDRDMALNESGDIVFDGQVIDPDANYGYHALYFMEDGVPKLFMDDAHVFDGQQVGGFSLVGLNDLRQMLLYLIFVGPDGIAYTPDDTHGLYLVTIPEPATLLLLGLGTAFARRRRPLAGR